MYLIIRITFVAVAILIVKQIMILKKEWNNCTQTCMKSNFNSSRYPDKINEIGKEAMEAVESGKVKKQLLPNDAPKYDSGKTLNQYIEFINSSELYQYLISLKEQKYNG